MTNGKTLFYTQHRIGCLIKCHSYCFKGPDNFLPEYSNQVILYFLLIEPFCFPPGSFLYPAQSFISHKNNNFYLYVCSFFSIGKCMFQLYSVPSYLTFLGLNTCTYETGIIMVADFTYCLPSNHQLFFLVNWPRSSFPGHGSERLTVSWFQKETLTSQCHLLSGHQCRRCGSLEGNPAGNSYFVTFLRRAAWEGMNPFTLPLDSETCPHQRYFSSSFLGWSSSFKHHWGLYLVSFSLLPPDGTRDQKPMFTLLSLPQRKHEVPKVTFNSKNGSLNQTSSPAVLQEVEEQLDKSTELSGCINQFDLNKNKPTSTQQSGQVLWGWSQPRKAALCRGRGV